MNNQEDRVFLLNFVIIIVMLLGLICLFIILSQVIGSSEEAIARDRAIVLINQTQPVGRIRRADTAEQAATAAPATAQTEATEVVDIGKKTYDSLCTSCHSTGLPNIPQMGSVADWAGRIAQGELLLYERAINGYTGESGMVMPARGGNPTLSDDEVRAAVDYIIENSQ